MELIEYEQVIPENNCLCKVFHSQLIENEKENLHANLGPLPHWHSSYEFNVCINGKLEHHIGNDIQFLESEEFIFINPNVVHVVRSYRRLSRVCSSRSRRIYSYILQ